MEGRRGSEMARRVVRVQGVGVEGFEGGTSRRARRAMDLEWEVQVERVVVVK